MDKFGRNYKLTVGTSDGGTLTIEPPFTVEFDITRNTLTSANVCQIRVYNLSLKHRNQIRHNVMDYNNFQPIAFLAGYGSNITTVFTGNISQAWSVREGTNFVTQIECFDGGFAFVNGETNTTFPKGTKQSTMIENLCSTLPHVSVGAIGSYPNVSARAGTYSGNTCEILREQTGGGFFIDNGKANALGTNEYISSVSGPILINSDSGLLGTPVLERTIVRFDMLFEPRLSPGGVVNLQSVTESNFNGIYKITGVKHRGMISDAVCGDAITTGEFFFLKTLTPVVPK